MSFEFYLYRFFNIFSSKSFNFNGSNFVREQESIDKKDSHNSLVGKKFKIEATNKIVINLIFIVDKINAINKYSLS